MNNIYLIGMMGSGKTTVGELLAERLGMRLVDLDAAIVADAQRTIPEIFAERGEAYFRELESNVLYDLHRHENLIVATGGGTPLLERNRHLMEHSGTVVYLERDADRIIETIDAETRPLLKANPENVHRIYAARRSCYEDAANCTVSNNGTAEEAAEAVIAAVAAAGQELPSLH
ncbi:MAG: shikimate kinase [Clostridia bacterium]|nr:shikimate kinase [Clostridia bacterium]